jgi:hypothetical protein
MLYRLSDISGNLLFLHSVKPFVQLVGNKLVCTRLCIDLLSATAWQERGYWYLNYFMKGEISGVEICTVTV